MATNYDAHATADVERDDAVQGSDKARALEIGDRERAGSELGDLISVPSETLNDNLAVEFCAWEPPRVSHSIAKHEKVVFAQDRWPGSECGPPCRLACRDAPAARDPRGCDRQSPRGVVFADQGDNATRA
jgi:hypothetical protein